VSNFEVGDFVWYRDELYEVKDTHLESVFIADVGEKVSGVITLWVRADELELDEYDDEDEQ
jgi:hypothetical protein